jgi:hypothetical protein
MKMKAAFLLASMALAALVIVPLHVANAQTPTATSTLSLTYTVPESLTLTVTPSSVQFNTNGVGSSSISATVTWNVYGTTTEKAWIVYPYFSSSTALVSSQNSANTVSTSQLTLSVDGGTAASCNGSGSYNHFTNNTGSSNVCPAIFYGDNAANTFTTANVPGTIPTKGTQTSTLALVITGTDKQNAGSYTGTLNLIASIE